jgi:hypothetical protein
MTTAAEHGVRNLASSCNSNEDFNCKSCQQRFPSKNALFKHLRLNMAKCLPESDVQYLTRGTSSRKEERVAVLYGYRVAQKFRERNIIEFCQVNYSSMEDEDISSTAHRDDDDDDDGALGRRYVVSGGESASQLLLEAIQIVSASSFPSPYPFEDNVEHPRIRQLRATRSYGWSSRNTSIVAQDDYTSACTEVLTARIPPFRIRTPQGDENEQTEKSQLNESVQQWVMEVNTVLLNMLRQATPTATDGNSSSTNEPLEAVEEAYGKIVVFGCIPIPKKFNAELDITLRKVEYMLPVDCFLQFWERNNMLDPTVDEIDKTQRCCDSLLTFQAGDLNIQPDLSTLRVLTLLKKLMQRFTTHCNEKHNISATTNENDKSSQTTNTTNSNAIAPTSKKVTNNMKKKKQQQQKKKNRNCNSSGKTKDSTEGQQQAHEMSQDTLTDSEVKDKIYTLRRKRYHNFTPHVMAHEFLAFRRMDRFYHAATERFDGLINVGTCGISTPSLDLFYFFLSKTFVSSLSFQYIYIYILKIGKYY